MWGISGKDQGKISPDSNRAVYYQIEALRHSPTCCVARIIVNNKPILTLLLATALLLSDLAAPTVAAETKHKEKGIYGSLTLQKRSIVRSKHRGRCTSSFSAVACYIATVNLRRGCRRLATASYPNPPTLIKNIASI